MNGTLTATDAAAPPRSRWTPRVVAFWVTLAAYVLLTVGVIMIHSPLLALDEWFYGLHLHVEHPQYERFVLDYVMLGQRGPATLVFLPYFCWVAWRTRSSRPLVMLGTALVLLNVSVGVVKLFTGRLGPQQTRLVHQVFMGGDIYPSGHVANTVVLYGLVAWITLWHRKLVITAAVFVCVTVSLGTVYLNTHWLSDVFGGLLAGALVLLALPTALPTTQRWTDHGVARLREWQAGRHAAGASDAQRPVPVGVARESHAEVDAG
jgi:membrane-associated phospholipid phosphatase